MAYGLEAISPFFKREPLPSRGLLDSRELGDFYLLVRDMEERLRQFIQTKLGRDWLTRIETGLPEVANGWKERRRKDESWGIEPEQDPMKYADLGDYIHIVRKYDRIFSDGGDDLARIVTYLTMWYNYGRNPIMHARTVSQQKYFTTKSAIDFLWSWIERKSKLDSQT